MYAVDGMGSAMAAAMRGTTVGVRGADAICCLLLERSDLSYIGRHAGRKPMETHAIKGELRE